MKPVKPDSCSLCKRELDIISELGFHHLIPKKVHDKRWVKEKHPELDLDHYGIWVCNDCHSKIHGLFDHRQLAGYYYTREAILSHTDFRKFLSWVRKQRKRVKR